MAAPPEPLPVKPVWLCTWACPLHGLCVLGLTEILQLREGSLWNGELEFQVTALPV